MSAPRLQFFSKMTTTRQLPSILIISSLKNYIDPILFRYHTTGIKCGIARIKYPVGFVGGSEKRFPCRCFRF